MAKRDTVKVLTTVWEMSYIRMLSGWERLMKLEWSRWEPKRIMSLYLMKDWGSLSNK